MTAGALFDEKYSNVKNTFIIRDDDSVYRFIENNENVFDLFEKIRPYLMVISVMGSIILKFTAILKSMKRNWH